MANHALASQNLTSVYIPADRRVALAFGLELPRHTTGAALFADISGFTPLTETLKRVLGERHGAEQLAQYLNQVYDALIAKVDAHGGSVIGFSGDAITCWFDDAFISDVYRKMENPPPEATQVAPAARRATACALALIEAMKQFAELEVPGQGVFALKVKVAVAQGPVQRLLAGNPDYQIIDSAAGETLQRMAAAEHLAEKGQVLIDSHTRQTLGDALSVTTQRVDPDTDEKYYVIDGLSGPPSQAPWPSILADSLPEALVLPWLLPPIYDRLTQGLGEFLTELRPAVALFLRFTGIEFEMDPDAGARLDAYIRWVQAVVTRYDGTFIQLTIGEKGSYLYVAFGAPRAHEDDPWRAVSAALELRNPPPELECISQVQIGLSMGTMRTGAYGSKTRRTYGVLGDDVNLAARLMQIAQPGQILVSGQIQEAVGPACNWQILAPMQIKGKREPVPVAVLLGPAEWRPAILTYDVPHIGREPESEQLRQATLPIFTGAGHYVSVVLVDGEAGVGKTRLIHELHLYLERAEQAGELGSGFQWYECPSDPILGQSLYPFRQFLRRYFNQDSHLSPDENRPRFERILDELLGYLNTIPSATDLAHELDRTRSMLGALVNLYWSDSLYEHLEPRQRFDNTLAGLRALILAESLRRPLILHIEDSHRLDADSQTMLKLLVRNSEHYPFILLLSGRYCDQDDQSCFNLTELLDQTVVITLKDLNRDAIARLAAKILSTSPRASPLIPPGADDLPVSESMLSFLIDKSNGNPLFLEALLQELIQRNLLTPETKQWNLQENAGENVPAGLNALLITRLDRLETTVKASVQTASVFGREFDFPVLVHMIPPDDRLRRMVDQAQVEQIWVPVEGSRYSFRQSLLRDAAYTMQPQTRLQELHALAASSILDVHAAELGPHYPDLAHHFLQAQNYAQALKFSRLAGESAAAEYATQQAIHFFSMALECTEHLPDKQTLDDRLSVHAALGELLVTTGQHQPASDHLNLALELSAMSNKPDAQARACRWLARLHENRGEYPQALEWIERGLEALGGRETVETSELLNNAGLILSRQGDYDAAQQQAGRCLQIAEHIGNPNTLARAHNLVGHIARLRGQSTTAIDSFTMSLHLYQESGDINGQALANNQIANALFGLGRWQDAENHFIQARTLFEQIGDIYHRAFVDNNLGWIALNQGKFDQALEYYQGGLAALELLGGSAYVKGAFHNNLGATYIRLGNAQAANKELATSLELFEQAGARDWLAELHRHKASAALLNGDLDRAESEADTAIDLACELKMRAEEGNTLRVMGEIAIQRGHTEQARQHLEHSLEVLKEVGDEFEHARSVLILARSGIQSPADTVAALEQIIPVLERLGASLELAEAKDLYKQG